MESTKQQEREVRAARNQALFRAVNERLTALNEQYASVTETFTVACECADALCVEMIDIRPDDYLAVRDEPRHFVVLPAHVRGDVETVVRESEGYDVVEKLATAAEVAELLAPAPQPQARDR
jgi:hypothetical protein